MGWIKRAADAHQCQKPTSPSGVQTGDRWKCDECVAVYEVTVNHDPRDWSAWLEWRQIANPEVRRG